MSQTKTLSGATKDQVQAWPGIEPEPGPNKLKKKKKDFMKCATNTEETEELTVGDKSNSTITSGCELLRRHQQVPDCRDQGLTHAVWAHHEHQQCEVEMQSEQRFHLISHKEPNSDWVSLLLAESLWRTRSRRVRAVNRVFIRTKNQPALCSSFVLSVY